MAGRVWCDRWNRTSEGCERDDFCFDCTCTTKADRVSSRLTVFAKLGYTAGYQWKGGTPLSPERSWGRSSFENDTEFEAVLSGIDNLTQS